ncbi:hypothetical protein [Rhodoblastus sp.]|uniref:hypothetical protein n=1 Tax=Rhodoblastus sp. TaxID=1962975 RepID=UPI003F9D2E28
MAFFTAVVLVCQLSTTPPGVCDESNAIDMISTHVESELGCAHGWQELISRGSLKEDLNNGFYVKTLCRRNVQALNASPSEGGGANSQN